MEYRDHYDEEGSGGHYDWSSRAKCSADMNERGMEREMEIGAEMKRSRRYKA